MHDAATTHAMPMTPGMPTNLGGGCAAGSAYSGFAATAATRIVASDVDEYTELLLDWDVELTQLRPGAFEGDVTLIPLEPVLIGVGRCNPSLLERGASPKDCITVARAGLGSAPVTIQGHEVGDGEAFVAGPGASYETVGHGLRFPRAISIKIDFLQSQANWLDASLLRCASGVHVHSPGPEWNSHFFEAIEWIADAALRYGDALARPDVSSSLIDTLLIRVDALGAVNSPLSNDREMRAARRIAVERAREYISANLTEPIRLSELCEHAKTQARSLEYGFREVMGVSPIAYVRAARLHRVRKLLRSAAVRTRSISEIALDCGFWHLSQFAVDYKHLFTESPSTTYRRTQSQLPRVERRRVALNPATARSSAAAAKSARIRSAIPAMA